jgi:hypothetical protein
MFCDDSDHHFREADNVRGGRSKCRRHRTALLLFVLFAIGAASAGRSSAEEVPRGKEELSIDPQRDHRSEQDQPGQQEQPSSQQQPAGIVSRIPHQPVESRALASVGYSTRLRALEIEFKRGGTYRYLEVPRSVYRDLLAAESKAGFYNKNVRGKYRSVYVRPKKR